MGPSCAVLESFIDQICSQRQTLEISDLRPNHRRVSMHHFIARDHATFSGQSFQQVGSNWTHLDSISRLG